MDNVEHEESFNSPNGKLSIIAIDRGASGDMRVTLSDGSSFFITESVLFEQKLHVDSIIGQSEYSRLVSLSEINKTWRKALDLLSRQDHTAYNLKRKLLSRGFSKAAVEEAVEMCRRSGSLDDERFAEFWIQSRMKRHPEGYRRLYAGLMKNGVDRELAVGVLSRIVTDEIEQEAAQRAALKLMRNKSMVPKKLISSMMSRGFNYSTIKAAMDAINEH
jgi:regulatory protein